MTITEERQKRIEKLPKWAQRYIGKLQRDVDWYKEQLAQASASDDADVSWDLGLMDCKRIGIPTRAGVYFRLENGRAKCKLEDGLLRIHTLAGRLVVRPEISNVISVILLPRDRH